MTRRLISLFLIISLIGQQTGSAQVVAQLDVAAHLKQLTSNILPQDHFRPIHLRYLAFDEAADSFKLLLDKGDSPLPRPPHKGEGIGQGDIPLPLWEGPGEGGIEEETAKLMRYFQIGLALPNSTFWVNLRPDAPDNIIEDKLAQTDIGRIMLEADVQLKKDTAAFTSPDTPEGREYWDKLYKKAGELFGTEQVEIPTYTRPWIVPGEIIIRETVGAGSQPALQGQGRAGLEPAPTDAGSQTANPSAYIYKATLKVLLEEDYVNNVGAGSQPALQGRAGLEPAPTIAGQADFRYKVLNEYSSELLRELVIPKITQAVNSAKRYAALRQVYYSLILAQWFKKQNAEGRGQNADKSTNPLVRQTGQTGSTGKTGITELIDSGNLSGLTSKEAWSKSTYFAAYRKSFKEGEYQKQETVYSPTGAVIRRYTSGGVVFPSGLFGPNQLLETKVTVVQASTTSASPVKEYLISEEITADYTLYPFDSQTQSANVPSHEPSPAASPVKQILKKISPWLIPAAFTILLTIFVSACKSPIIQPLPQHPSYTMFQSFEQDKDISNTYSLLHPQARKDLSDDEQMKIVNAIMMREPSNGNAEILLDILFNATSLDAKEMALLYLQAYYKQGYVNWFLEDIGQGRVTVDFDSGASLADIVKAKGKFQGHKQALQDIFINTLVEQLFSIVEDPHNKFSPKDKGTAINKLVEMDQLGRLNYTRNFFDNLDASTASMINRALQGRDLNEHIQDYVKRTAFANAACSLLGGNEDILRRADLSEPEKSLLDTLSNQVFPDGLREEHIRYLNIYLSREFSPQQQRIILEEVTNYMRLIDGSWFSPEQRAKVIKMVKAIKPGDPDITAPVARGRFFVPVESGGEVLRYAMEYNMGSYLKGDSVFDKAAFSSRGEELRDQGFIFYPERFSFEEYCKIKQGMSEEISADEKAVLFLAPMSDHNSAFAVNEGRKSGGAIELLFKKGYKIIYREVNTDEEAERFSMKAKIFYGQVDAIIYAGHGNIERLQLGGTSWRSRRPRGDQFYLSTTDEAIFSSIGSILKQGGTIIFYSCSTGEHGQSMDNLGNTARRATPWAKHVIAPLLPAGQMRSIEYDGDGNIVAASFELTPSYDAGKVDEKELSRIMADIYGIKAEVMQKLLVTRGGKGYLPVRVSGAQYYINRARIPLMIKSEKIKVYVVGGLAYTVRIGDIRSERGEGFFNLAGDDLEINAGDGWSGWIDKDDMGEAVGGAGSSAVTDIDKATGKTTSKLAKGNILPAIETGINNRLVRFPILVSMVAVVFMLIAPQSSWPQGPVNTGQAAITAASTFMEDSIKGMSWDEDIKALYIQGTIQDYDKLKDVALKSDNPTRSKDAFNALTTAMRTLLSQKSGNKYKHGSGKGPVLNGLAAAIAATVEAKPGLINSAERPLDIFLVIFKATGSEEVNYVKFMTGSVTRSQVEDAKLNWPAVAGKLIQNGWAKPLGLGIEVRLTVDLDATKDEISKAFQEAGFSGEDISRILLILQQSQKAKDLLIKEETYKQVLDALNTVISTHKDLLPGVLSLYEEVLTSGLYEIFLFRQITDELVNMGVKGQTETLNRVVDALEKTLESFKGKRQRVAPEEVAINILGITRMAISRQDARCIAILKRESSNLGNTKAEMLINTTAEKCVGLLLKKRPGLEKEFKPNLNPEPAPPAPETNSPTPKDTGKEGSSAIIGSIVGNDADRQARQEALSFLDNDFNKFIEKFYKGEWDDSMLVRAKRINRQLGNRMEALTDKLKKLVNKEEDPMALKGIIDIICRGLNDDYFSRLGLYFYIEYREEYGQVDCKAGKIVRKRQHTFNGEKFNLMIVNSLVKGYLTSNLGMSTWGMQTSQGDTIIFLEHFLEEAEWYSRIVLGEAQGIEQILIKKQWEGKSKAEIMEGMISFTEAHEVRHKFNTFLLEMLGQGDMEGEMSAFLASLGVSSVPFYSLENIISRAKRYVDGVISIHNAAAIEILQGYLDMMFAPPGSKSKFDLKNMRPDVLDSLLKPESVLGKSLGALSTQEIRDYAERLHMERFGISLRVGSYSGVVVSSAVTEANENNQKQPLALGSIVGSSAVEDAEGEKKIAEEIDLFLTPDSGKSIKAPTREGVNYYVAAFQGYDQVVASRVESVEVIKTGEDGGLDIYKIGEGEMVLAQGLNDSERLVTDGILNCISFAIHGVTSSGEQMHGVGHLLYTDRDKKYFDNQIKSFLEKIPADLQDVEIAVYYQCSDLDAEKRKNIEKLKTDFKRKFTFPKIIEKNREVQYRTLIFVLPAGWGIYSGYDFLGRDIDSLRMKRRWAGLFSNTSGINPGSSQEQPSGSAISAAAGVQSEQLSPGGIDFRSLPASSPLLAEGLRSGNGLRNTGDGALTPILSELALDNEWREIEKLVNVKVIPSAQRLKSYCLAAGKSLAYQSRREKMRSCIADILRLEEDLAISTDPVVREILMELELSTG